MISVFPSGSVVENPPVNAGDEGSVHDPGRSHILWSNQAQMPQLLSLCSSTRESECLKTQSMRTLESAHNCTAYPLWSPSAPATGTPTGCKMSPMPQSWPNTVRAVTVSKCKRIKFKVRTSWEDTQLEDWTIIGINEILLKGKFHNSSFLFITERSGWWTNILKFLFLRNCESTPNLPSFLPVL